MQLLYDFLWIQSTVWADSRILLCLHLIFLSFLQLLRNVFFYGEKFNLNHSIILYFISKTIINQQYSTAKIHVKNAGHIGLFKLRFGEGIFVCLKSLSTSFNANSYSMMCTIEILYQHWWHSLFIFDFKTPFQYEHWGCSFEDIDIKGWNSKLFSHLNKKLSCFVTFKKILESFEKFILQHDFYSKWTIAGCFFDKKG